MYPEENDQSSNQPVLIHSPFVGRGGSENPVLLEHLAQQTALPQFVARTALSRHFSLCLARTSAARSCGMTTTPSTSPNKMSPLLTFTRRIRPARRAAPSWLGLGIGADRSRRGRPGNASRRICFTSRTRPSVMQPPRPAPAPRWTAVHPRVQFFDRPLQASTGTVAGFEIVHQCDFDFVGIFTLAYFVGEHVQPGAGASDQHQVFVERRTNGRIAWFIRPRTSMTSDEHRGTQAAKLIGVVKPSFFQCMHQRSRTMIAAPTRSMTSPHQTSHVRFFSTLLSTSSFTPAT